MKLVIIDTSNVLYFLYEEALWGISNDGKVYRTMFYVLHEGEIL